MISIPSTSHKGQVWAIVILSILLAGMIGLTIYFGIEKSRCENVDNSEKGARIMMPPPPPREAPHWPLPPDVIPPVLP